MRTKDGILITEIDANLSYVGTEDGRGYGPRNLDETLIAKTNVARDRLAAHAQRKAEQAEQDLYGDVRRYDVHWHWLVLPGNHTATVTVGGDPEMGGTTEDDIPAIIAVQQTGTNKNADLIVIDGLQSAAAKL